MAHQIFTDEETSKIIDHMEKFPENGKQSVRGWLKQLDIPGKKFSQIYSRWNNITSRGSKYKRAKIAATVISGKIAKNSKHAQLKKKFDDNQTKFTEGRKAGKGLATLFGLEGKVTKIEAENVVHENGKTSASKITIFFAIAITALGGLSYMGII